MSVLQKADVGMIENGYAQKAETGQMRPNAAVHEWLLCGRQYGNMNSGFVPKGDFRFSQYYYAYADRSNRGGFQ